MIDQKKSQNFDNCTLLKFDFSEIKLLDFSAYRMQETRTKKLPNEFIRKRASEKRIDEKNLAGSSGVKSSILEVFDFCQLLKFQGKNKLPILVSDDL